MREDGGNPTDEQAKSNGVPCEHAPFHFTKSDMEHDLENKIIKLTLYYLCPYCQSEWQEVFTHDYRNQWH